MKNRDNSIILHYFNIPWTQTNTAYKYLSFVKENIYRYAKNY